MNFIVMESVNCSGYLPLKRENLPNMKLHGLCSSSLRLVLAVSLYLAGVAVSPGAPTPKRLLVVTTTEGFHHSSIPTAEKILAEIGEKSGVFTVEYARVPYDTLKGADGKPDTAMVHEANTKVLAEKMSAEALKHYDGVIFANTTGDLPLPDKQAFLDWIKSGKAFMGMHSATDTFRGHTPLDPYVEMIGAEFKHHDKQAEVDCIVQDPKSPATRHLPNPFHLKDEIYLMNGFEQSRVHALLGLDKKPDGTEPGYFPIAWCKMYGKGRVFYTSLGHREDVWDPNTPESFKRENPTSVSEAYQKHVLGGIKWALGLEKGEARPQLRPTK
jgi:type 1 glutamine amidotransferase